ncbi:tetratricopeptide repeat protein [Geomonas subterranea]|uniref:Tetratricopeptide repeat protein n=1 Tax=Geomonas subterranea TaxID=2847989 RepID=A0ABX8LF95_9BACT|nr:tetratricopeptide repeat protein [Geomonas subterranea]QXE90347.1 tetratricopeptide repeat protein [Geomonas subterranea]QXM07527.1 tetratricopeptide repeat protein [Geomonas subterranea]
MQSRDELKQALAENRVERADELCREQLRETPEDVDLLTLSGVLARLLDRPDQALEAFSRAATLDPAQAELHNNLGVILEDLGRFEEAQQRYRAALELKPDYPEAMGNLGNALLKLGRLDEAVARFCDAIALDPGYGNAYYHLGHALRAQGEWQGAARCYRKVVDLQPDHLKGWVNLGGSLLALNDFEEALAALRMALSLDHDSVDAHWNLALVLLALGEYREGWREYQWRLKDPAGGFSAGVPGRQMWDGSPLAGRTLLVRAEQGFGDAIQFFRYARLLARRGEKVVLECRRELLPLFAAQGDPMLLCAAGDAPPPFDTFTYLMSLPHLLGTTLESIPPQGAPLRADAALRELWREQAAKGPGLKVGVVWAGSAGYKRDRYRSLPARALAPLASLPGVTLFNLQLGAAAEDLAILSAAGTVIDLTPALKDFAHTAALIDNLDLVVSVDTAVAHLAAAMGKPVHLLLPFSCDWRWLHGRSDSPWYPSVTLHRQPAPGEWQPVVDSVRGRIAALCGGGGQDPNLLFREANRLRMQGDTDGAVTLYRALLARLPECAEVYNNLGLALQDQGLWAEAEASYRRAMELKPQLADAYNNLGTLLVGRAEHDDAEPLFRRAVALDPAYLPAYVNLGSCLQVLEEPAQAVDLYRHAIALDPGYLEARINLGTAWQDLMQPQQAIETYRELLRLAPEHPEAHWNLALSLLSVGDFQEGWREYEWRLAGCQPELAVPLWRGEELSGRTILLQCEQGLGDTLQFIRYAPLVAQRGGRVVVRCQIPALKPLLARVPGVAAVYAPADELPPCDWQVQLLSLPHLFGTTLEKMPPWRPYLFPEERRAALWSLMLEEGATLKVGLVWRGGPLPRNRACPFKEFAPLADMPGVIFYSLQLGEAPDPDLLPAVDLAPQIKDFGDTAAILAGLDLLVTVDTAAAHLAGGMGMPVWLLLPYSCDWRWFAEREDSPWYPAMRIFRQGRPGDWPGVMGRIRAALQERLSCQ